MWIRITIAALFLAIVAGTANTQTTCGVIPPLTAGGSKEEQLRARFQSAVACIREAKPAQAVDIFSEMIGIDPENEAAYMNRGNAYLQMGQVSSSIADFSWVIALKPEAVDAWYNKGIAYIVARQYDKGIADLGEAVRLKPDFSRAYCNRGLGLVRKGAYDMALTDLDEGIKRDPSLGFVTTHEETCILHGPSTTRRSRILPRA
jgi:tetratricopeptide (TPR) repeat protein